MAALRSRRLERLLGARLDAISHVQVVDHVTNAVTEAYDLDFKGELYGNADNGPAISQGALEATRRAAVELLERGTHSEGGRRDRIQRDQWGVNPMTAVAVYDAYGHTARFVVADLRGRGFTPVFCGRDTQRLRALAAEHPGAQIRHACSTRQPVSLDRALAGSRPW